MTKGDKRRKRRKYRVRYDRIVVLVLIIIVIAVIITSFIKAFSDKEETSESESSNSVSDTEIHDDDSSESEPQLTDVPDATEPPAENSSSVKLPHDDIYKGDLILVNAEYEYKFPENDIDVITLYDNKNSFYGAGDYVTELDREVITQLNAMVEAFASAQGLSSTDIFILDGYRTYDEQVERHNSGKSKTFEAGHTDYHTGRTFDMFRTDEYSGSGFSLFSAVNDCAWFADNAGSYGFIVRYPEGKAEATGENPRTYTYRYVGVPHASYINTNNLCLEEYIAEVKAHTKESPLEITADGHSYGVYYVAAETEGETAVDVPADMSYTISGDNGGGFIVTVTLS